MPFLEKTIITAAGLVCLISLCFIPKKKADRASFIFLLTQFFSWILGLIVVQFAWLEYPVHLLAKANSTSFLFEYFVLPIITTFFILHYPFIKPLRLRILYYVTFSSAFTLIEFFAERYTMIIKYHSWRWYWTWISMSLVFYVVMVIYKWFYKINKVFTI